MNEDGDREVFTTSGTYPWSFVIQMKPGSAYDKWNISVVICDTYIP